MPWTESPFFEALAAEADLAADDLELVTSFSRDGIAVFDPEIPDRLLDEVVTSTHRCYKDLPGRRVNRVQDGWRRCPPVGELAAWPRVLDVLELLYRRPAMPFQTLNFEWGTEQRTHADTTHFQSHPANWMAGVWVALEDVDEHNGPVHYVPGSHRLPVYGPDELGVAADMRTAYPIYQDFVDALIEKTGMTRQPITLPRGRAIVMAANILHGGSPILDQDRTRRSQVSHYFFAGCTYYRPMNTELFLGRVSFEASLVDLRTGRPIGHRYKGHEFRPRQRPIRPVVPAGQGGDPRSLKITPRSWAGAVARRTARRVLRRTPK